jgi:hypothetical protein
MTVLEIQSVGAPPERHADRIVADMMRHLAEQQASLWETVNDVTKSPHTRDGNPRAQHITRPEGIRVPFPNHSSVMVLKQHEKHKALVVTTVF